MQYLHQVKETLTQQGALSVDYRLVCGHAASAILDLIDEIPNSLVALTTHGRSGVGRWVWGSLGSRQPRVISCLVGITYGVPVCSSSLAP